MHSALKVTATLIGIIFLSECVDRQLEAANQRTQAAKADFAARNAVCEAQYPLKVGSYRQRALCKNSALMELNNQADGGQDVDLLTVFAATRLSLGAKADRHELSLEDYELQVASAWSQGFSAANQRHAQQNAARTAAMIPLMQMQQQMQEQNFQQQQRQMNFYRPRPPINCTSNRMGDMISTNCN